MTDKQIIIIGGGPAGSTAAMRLLQLGHRPLILERVEFPRFHVGESLVPASQGVWDRAGLVEQMQHSRYEFKYASRVLIGDRPDQDGATGMTVQFSKVPSRQMPLRPFAYQVERAVFDKQLLDWAVARGAELRKASATKVLFDGDRATGVHVRNPDGSEEELRADFVIDASGRRALIASQLGILHYDPVIQTSAVFGHFENVARESGQGFFEAYLVENGWFWLIPLIDNRMSVGLVQNRPECDAWGNDAEQVLLDAINRYRWMRRRFVDARQVAKVRMLRKLAYQSERMAGDGWLAVGDAFFFIDPLFSTGVHIAMKTAQSGAEAVDAFLRGGRDLSVLRSLEEDYMAYRDLTLGFVRSVYGLLRRRLSAGWAVGVCGPLCRDLDTWVLRRLTYWLSGHYETNWGVMRGLTLGNRLMAAAAGLVDGVAGRQGWDAFRKHPNPDPPLQIPKAIPGWMPEMCEQDRELVVSCS